MKTRITILVFIMFVLKLTAQQTIEKKEFYDNNKTQIKKMWHETNDGKYQGLCIEYYQSGKIAKKSMFYHNDVVNQTDYNETGELIYVLNKNNSFQFNGEQKKYKIINGKPVLERYAKLDNGKIIEYYWYNTPKTYLYYYKNNVYKKFDEKGNVILKIENGIINGMDGNVFLENNRITQFKDERTDVNLITNCKSFEFKFYYIDKSKNNKLVLVQHGFCKLKNDSSNYVKFLGYSYEAYGNEPVLNVKIDLDLNTYFNGINKYATKDSIWQTYRADGSLNWVNVFKNDQTVSIKEFYQDEKLKKEINYKDGVLFNYLEYGENGEITGSTEMDNEKEKQKLIIEAQKKEVELKINEISSDINKKYNEFCKIYIVKETTVSQENSGTQPKYSYPKGEYIYKKGLQLYNENFALYNSEKNNEKKIEIGNKMIKILDKLISISKTDTRQINKKLKKTKTTEQIEQVLGL